MPFCSGKTLQKLTTALTWKHERYNQHYRHYDKVVGV
jgi:hypothetical protein